MIDQLPHDACRILGAARTVNVAVNAARGPHVTPQAYLWTGDSLCLVTGPVALLGPTLGGPACLTVERSDGVRMSRFAGLLLRGALDDCEGTLQVERASWWHGFVTGTVPAPVVSGGRR